MAQKEKVFKITIDGLEKVTTASEAIKLLNEEQKRLTEELKKLPQGSEGYNAMASSLASLETQISELNGEVEKGAEGNQNYSDSLLNTSASSDLTNKSLGELKLEISGIEEEMEGLKVGDKKFEELAIKSKKLEKALEAAQLQAESVALGFVGIGKAGNTVEGLSVQVAALNAKLATLNDPLEKAAVDKQIEQIKIAIIDAEAEARKGIFPEGSIGRLEAEFESLQIKIKAVPATSKEFKTLQVALDQTRAEVDFLNLAATEQQQIFRDLGTGIASAFVGGAGLIASFAGDSEDANKSILILQQSLAAVEFLNNLSETIRQAREAKKVAALALETSLQEATNVALAQNVVLQEQAAAATNLAAKSTKGAGSAFELLNAVIRANPIGFVITAIGALAAGIFLLSGKFKFFGDIVNFTKDAFSGLVKGAGAFIDNIDKFAEVAKNFGSLVVQYMINPLDSVKAVLNTFGAGFETTKLEKKFQTLANSAKIAGGAVGDAFAEGMNNSAKLRRLDIKEQLNQATDAAAQLAEATLGSARATTDARRSIRLKELAEDRANAVERVKLENNLTDAEFAILQSGNEKKIAEIKKFQDARGGLNSDALKAIEGFGKVADVEKTILGERDAANQEYFQDRIAQISNTLTLELEKLGELNTFDKQRIAQRKTEEAELGKLVQQRAAGEFKTELEFETLKNTIIAKGVNERKVISKEESEFARSIRDLDRESEINQIQSTLDLRRSLNETTFSEEKKALTDISNIRLQSLNDEAELLEKQKDVPENVQRLKEIEQERVGLARELNAELGDSQLAFIEKALALGNRNLDLAEQRLQIEREITENQSLLDAQYYEDISIQIGNIRNTYKDINNLSESYTLEQKLVNDQLLTQQKTLTENYNANTKSLQVEQERLLLQEQANVAKKEAGKLSQEDFERAQEEITIGREKLKQNEVNLKVRFDIDTKKAANDAKQAAAAAGAGFIDAFSTSMDAPLENAISDGLTKSFTAAIKKSSPNISDEAAKAMGAASSRMVQKLGGQLLTGLGELGNAIASNLSAGIDAKIAEVGERQALLDEQLAATEEQIGLTEERLTNLYSALSEARDSDAGAVTTQIDAQITKQQELKNVVVNVKDAQKNAAKETLALEAEKQEMTKKQAIIGKSIAVGQAVINTALAIANTIATVPKVDFGVSTGVLVGLYSAIGAAQIATILATPLPARDGGLLGDDGKLTQSKNIRSAIQKMAKGGFVRGKSHAQGGVRGTGKFNNVEVEGGEAIISKSVVNQHPTLVRSLVEKGSNPNISLPTVKFADGGILPNVSEVQAGSDDIIKAINQIDIRPTVSITDINEGQKRVATIERSSKL